jgi:tetratricopeptide (TPR) repeat protein
MRKSRRKSRQFRSTEVAPAEPEPAEVAPAVVAPAELARKEPSRGISLVERLAPLLIVLAGIASYSNAFRGPFVLDDLTAIPNNASIRTFGNALSPPAHSPVTGRPLVNLSLAFNYALGGLDVTSYHVVNVAIHLLAALVLFGIVRRTLAAPRMSERYRDAASGIATAVALLWVVHPLTTESVDYTIQRTELLMGLFFLLTLYCALRGFESRKAWRWHAAALAAFALGLGSKEVIAVAPVVVLAYDWLFWSPSFKAALRRHRILYIGFAVVLLLFALFVGTRLRGAFTGLSRRMSPWDYALTQSGAIVRYLRLAVWPRPLAADYDGWPIATSLRSVLPYVALLLSLVALTLWGLVRRRALAFVGVWFFLILAPTSSFRPLAAEVVAERRMYLPLAAAVVLAVLAGRALLARIAAPRGVGIASVAVLAAILGIVTVRRNETYRTTLSFWNDIVAKRPDNPRARIWLAKHLREAGRNAEAVQHLTTAVHLQPRNGDAQYSLGVALASAGRTEEAIEHYREALRINPQDASAHNNLGAALASRGEIAEAIDQYLQAIRINPAHAGAHYNLALVLANLGELQEAIAHLESAIRVKPDFSTARQMLKDLRQRTGQ